MALRPLHVSRNRHADLLAGLFPESERPAHKLPRGRPDRFLLFFQFFLVRAASSL